MSNNGIQIDSFSRAQTEIMKGVGILIIVLHNFFHNLSPGIGENQFSFRPDRFSKFYLTIADNPFELMRASFSYFGHYGVQIFIFFSAYGLTRKYLNQDIKISSFLKRRVGKIYASFLLCVALYICLGIAKETFITNEQVLYWDSLLWKTLLISNFIPDQALMPVGPWWFMPFIFQVYLFYPLLLNLFKKYGNSFLIITAIGSIVVELYLNPHLQKSGLNLNFMIFGHLPVLCAGIYFAAQKRIRFGYGILAVSLSLFILGNYDSSAWVLGDLTFTILTLALAISIIGNTSGNTILAMPLAFYGGLSLQLFMVNGFLRSPFHNFAESHNVWWIDNIAALISLAASTLFAIVLSTLDKRIRHHLTNWH
ncbi:MAG: acyltransferase [Gammaproteobacteria bacterium]|nr:acyltransferase [Gammaproteobacteria bacterium]